MRFCKFIFKAAASEVSADAAQTDMRNVFRNVFTPCTHPSALTAVIGGPGSQIPPRDVSDGGRRISATMTATRGTKAEGESRTLSARPPLWLQTSSSRHHSCLSAVFGIWDSAPDSPPALAAVIRAWGTGAWHSPPEKIVQVVTWKRNI
ncbi:hypothetical protein AOLI_G00190280 [Acnodon oligacanthus]